MGEMHRWPGPPWVESNWDFCQDHDFRDPGRSERKSVRSAPSPETG